MVNLPWLAQRTLQNDQVKAEMLTDSESPLWNLKRKSPSPIKLLKDCEVNRQGLLRGRYKA